MARVAPPSGGNLSYAQLEGLWIAGGGSPRRAPLMAAIALAESGGNPAARNPSGASGIWQILGQPFPGDVFDPLTNARMAVAKYRSQGLGAWQAYTNGSFKKFLRPGVPPVPWGGQAGVPYKNPFRSVRGLVAERVDMGVDYAGTGPVYAIGPGVITQADRSWAGGLGTGPGWFIEEKLSQGPLKGRYVYLSEHVTPTVHVGQRVSAGTQIGVMSGGIETGFAAGPAEPSTTLAQQLGQIPAGGDPGAHPTASGAAYSRLLHALGAPAGTMSGPAVGQNPSWLQKFISNGLGFIGGAAGGVAGGASGGGGALASIATTLSDLDTAITWLINPSNWIRIISGVTGGIMVIGGIFVLSGLQAKTSASVPYIGGAASAVQSSVRLPVGIGLVGAGGVLLFIAFHNLPGDVTDLSSLLAYERQQLQTSASGKAAAL